MQLDFQARELTVKLVYYGPGLGGKTTNLEYVYGKVNPDTRAKLISLARKTRYPSGHVHDLDPLRPDTRQIPGEF